MLVRKANMKALIRLLRQKQSDLGLHCLFRPFWQTISVQNFRTFTVPTICGPAHEILVLTTFFSNEGSDLPVQICRLARVSIACILYFRAMTAQTSLYKIIV